MSRHPKQVVLDEIALEGLEGITLETLWIRLAQVDDFEWKPVNNAIKSYLFENVICKASQHGQDFEFYVLPQARPTLQLYNRYDHVNPETGFCVSNEEGIPDDIYATIAPINQDGVRGSCKDYHTRKNVTTMVLNKCRASYTTVSNKFGQRLVLVATQHQRERALSISALDPFIDLNITQYCILERVARSRYMGEITIGKEMANFKESAKTQYYFRKVLIKKGFIRKQVHTMYNSKTHVIFRGLLLMHSRFFVERKSPIEVAAKRLSDILLQCDNQECDYGELKERMNIKPKLYRNLYQAYLKHFAVIEKEEPSNKRVKSKIVRLLKPFYGEEDNEEETDDADDDDQYADAMDTDQPTGVGGNGNGNGNTGQSITLFTCPQQVQQKARIYSAQVLSLNRTLLSTTYFLIESHDSAHGISLREVQEKLKLPRLDVRMLIRMLERLQEVESIRIEVGRQKVSKYFLKHRQEKQFRQISTQNVDLFPGEIVSLTFARRANLILEMVRSNKIIDQMNILKKMLMENEKNLPYTIDPNSVHSIVRRLAKQGLVRWIKTKLVSKDRITKINVICVPSITANDPLIRERIEQAKFRYFGNVKEETNDHNMKCAYNGKQCMVTCNGDTNNNQQADAQVDDDYVHKQFRMIRDKPVTDFNNDIEDLILYQPTIGRKYGVEPKMKKMMTLYRFLHFLMNGGPKSGEQFRDWRQFITPLPEGREQYTCLLGDLVRRIPLSIFVKVVFITYVIPGLNDLLQHPVHCNYPLHMVSDDIRRLLLHRRKYIFSIIEVLTMLSYMNLVELRSEKISAKESVVVKLLKHASFVDDGLVRNYELNSMDDVDKFVTDLGFHASKSDCVNCSLDSRLWVHNPRNWSYTPKLKRDLKVNRTFKRLQRLNSGINGSTPPKNQCNTSLWADQKPSINVITITTGVNQISGAKNVDTPVQQRNNLKRKLADTQVPEEKCIRAKGKDADERPVKRARCDYDAVDKIALRLMKKQRCEWSREEDSFLLMCRVASAMLDPTCPTFICVNRGVVRDELHRYLPKLSYDKTSKACQRRIMYMLKNSATKAHILDWVAECKQDAELAAIKKPTQPKSHRQVWNGTFVTLLHKLLNKFETNQLARNGLTASGSQFPRFQSINEITNQYTMIENELNVLRAKVPLHQQPQNVVDICINSVLNILVSTLMINRYEQDSKSDQSTPTAQTLFKIYQRYPDTLIRSVVAKAQKHGVIAKTKNHLSSSLLRSKGLIPYKISQHYQFVLRTRYCIDSLAIPLANHRNYCVQDKFGSSETAFVVTCFVMRHAHFALHIPDNFIILDESHPFYGCTTGCQTPAPKSKPVEDLKSSSRFALYMLRQQLDSQPRDKIQHVQDYLVLNKCSIRVTSLFEKCFEYGALHDALLRQQRLCHETNVHVDDLEHVHRFLVQHVEQYREIGVAEADVIWLLGDQYQVTEDQAHAIIAQLINDDLIYRVGVLDIRLVHHRHATSWQIISSGCSPEASNDTPTNGSFNESTVNQIRFLARFWKDPFGQLDKRVMFNYLSGLLAHVMAHPGIKQQQIIAHFEICLPPAQIIEVLDLLVLTGCLHKIQLSVPVHLQLFRPTVSRPQYFYECSPQAFIQICQIRQLFAC